MTSLKHQTKQQIHITMSSIQEFKTEWTKSELVSIGWGEITGNVTFNTTNNIRNVIKLISVKGYHRILVEGGSQISTSLLKNNLIDQIYWFKTWRKNPRRTTL